MDEPTKGSSNDLTRPSVRTWRGYRLRKYLSRKLPFIVLDPDMQEILVSQRARDDEENAKTEPPPDESIDQRCIWAVELYTPSQVLELSRSFEKLGWNKNAVGDVGGSRNPALWLTQNRESARGGGWFNLGSIRRPNDKRFYGTSLTAPLPPGVDYAVAKMYSLTSSITCIVVAFFLDEQCGTRAHNVLKRKRCSFLSRLPGGAYHFPDPGWQKQTEIRAIRSDLRGLAADWFRSHLPGIFSSGALKGEFPTCELITLREAEPFPEGRSAADEWLQLLGIEHAFDVWQAVQLPGLKFVWPLLRGSDTRQHAILACRVSDIPDEKLEGYGKDRQAYSWLVDQEVNGLLSRWALLGLLSAFESHLNRIRDSASLRPKTKPLRLLDELGEHLSLSGDVSAASADLGYFTEQKWAFDRDFSTFRPRDRRSYKDKDITLSEALRQRIKGRSEWLQRVENSTRALLTEFASTVGAQENIKLQKRMTLLTWVITALTIAIFVLTAVTTVSSFKEGDLSWLWDKETSASSDSRS